MIHIEFFDSRSAALAREKQLKGGQGRAWIRKILIRALKSAGFISA
jgi:predicted GIY-YIG superfamily endonuclease